MKYNIPKGTFDILPVDLIKEDLWKASERWQYLEEVIRSLCTTYGYKEIRTPIFERTELFIRGVGESSDIVSKEMYNFEDKGNRSMTLRPEGTAPVMRSIIENHIQQHSSLLKLFYIGPYFRYDRPQAGRYRQFHQFGIEAIGDSSPEQDFEVIDMLCQLFQRLGLKNLQVLINSVGSLECRNRYKSELKAYLKPHFEELSEESKRRFEHNPLRILDSKDPGDRALLKNAPSILDYLNEESSAHFEKVKMYLTKLNIPFTVTPSLVRGLDYYNKTVFEITSDVLGAQNTIGGGGRFDGLLSSLGGADLPAMGFAAGLERILQTMIGQKCFFPQPHFPFLYFIPLGDKSKEFCISLLYALRHKGIPSDIYLRGKKLQKALQTAEANKTTYALIIGDDELSSNVAELKEMKTRETKKLTLDTLQNTIETLWSQNS